MKRIFVKFKGKLQICKFTVNLSENYKLCKFTVNFPGRRYKLWLHVLSAPKNASQMLQIYCKFK